MTESILEMIRRLGYAVSVHHMDDYVEMHAIELKDADNQHIARVIGDDGENSSYRCACELAKMVGIDLADG